MDKNNTFLSQIAYNRMAVDMTEPVPNGDCHYGQEFLNYHPMEMEQLLCLTGGKDAR